MTAESAQRLAALLEREAAEPASWKELGSALADLPSGAVLEEFLRAKEERERAAWFVEGEALWFQKLTWRLMRPLFLVAVLGAVGFALQRAVDPTLGIALFLFGAAAYYVTVQFLSHFWLRADRKRLAEIDRRYRERLEALRERGSSS